MTKKAHIMRCTTILAFLVVMLSISTLNGESRAYRNLSAPKTSVQATSTLDISNRYAGAYLINAPGINGAAIINTTGQTLTNVSLNDIPEVIPGWKYPTNDCGVFGVEYLSNGNFLLQVGYNVMPDTRSGIWNLTTGEFVYPVRPGCIVELDADNNLVWFYVSDSDVQWPHDVERCPNGNTLIARTGL